MNEPTIGKCVRHPPGPYVLLKDVKDIVAIISKPSDYYLMVNKLKTYYPPDSKAEELLTKVVNYIYDPKEMDNFTGSSLRDLHDIPGLTEWWAKHKPKSEREQKLEKVKSILSHNFSVASDIQVKLSAEEILEALTIQ